MIAPGSLLGPYEILATLGSGGMGVVYRARDVRLGRAVAIKVLPADVAGDEDRLRRFEQEARAASSLNHPNILVVHDIGIHEGLPYIVSELLEGETLRGQLIAGSIPQRKALDYAMQIAGALAAAHDKGIVHRDLKPENLFVTDDGRVKILDFGLAKLARPETADAFQPEVPTATLETQAGLVVGTVAYMSPEQIRALPTDRRTDIFSFGIILYELIAGERPFKGDTSVDTITAILTKDPFDVPEPIPALTQPLARVIEHCLDKKPESRFQSARDVAFALETFSSLPRAAAEMMPHHKRWKRAAGVVLALLVLYTVGVCVVARRGLVPHSANISFRQLTSKRGSVFSARFTPDGHTVLYGAAWDGQPVQLFTSPADRPESSTLAVPGADILSVSRSGELAVSLGRQYVNGFATSGTLARASLGSGGPREILEGVQDADWSPRDGELAITRRVEGRHCLEWPAGRVLQTTTGWFSHARVSPNGDLIAVFDHPIHGDDRGAVAVSDRHGSKRILSDGWASLSGLAWSPSGDEVWFTGSMSGTRRGLHAVDMAGKVRSLLRVPGSVTLYDVARTGTVLLATETLRSAVAGLAPGAASERDLSWTDFSIASDLASDGRTVLLSEQGIGTSRLYDVYLRRTDGSAATRLGEGLGMALSPDEKWVLTLMVTSPPELILLPTRAGESRRLPRGGIQEYTYTGSWFPDSKRVLFQARDATGQSRLYAQSIDGGPPTPITPEGVHLTWFSADPVSPDGRTVAALGADEQIRLYPLAGGGPTAVPGLGAGEIPLIWSRDGESLYTLQWQEAAHVRIHRVELRSHRKTTVRDIGPRIPGMMSIMHLQAAMDASAYVYTYWQLLSDLYVVEGVR